MASLVPYTKLLIVNFNVATSALFTRKEGMRI